MDGCGWAKDNIWVESFWRTIKYSIFTFHKRYPEARYTAESKDSLITITTTEDIKESIAKFTSIRQLD